MAPQERRTRGATIASVALLLFVLVGWSWVLGGMLGYTWDGPSENPVSIVQSAQQP